MVDPQGINFGYLEHFKRQYRFRQDIVSGKLENPYDPDPAFPLGAIEQRTVDERHRCSKYEFHVTFKNSVLCPSCGADLL